MIEDVTDERELEDRLRQAQKLEAIGRLAGGVAHDFNNMLTAISGYNTLALDRTPAESPLRADLHEIRKATDRATLLTRQLLAFSRKQILQPELLNLNAVVLDLESMLRPLIGEDIVLTTALDPALAPIEADPGQLQQVVMNLVVNARDAMPSGGVLALETANVDIGEGDPAMEPGGYVTLTVRDSGHGIDEATLQQIFEPFFTTKDVGKGTGLGLATVYGIVKQSGGYIWVESEPGAGAAFRIALPVSRTPLTGDGSSEAAEPAGGSETVMLVEDEDALRHLDRQILMRYGYRVLHARSGPEALALAQAHPEPIDLLLTDVVLPLMSGRQLADELQRSQPGMKVLYMSGYTADEILRHGVSDASMAFIQKPMSPVALACKVRDVLDS
jgi:nitrogen-specific signal transduction histidine kinase